VVHILASRSTSRSQPEGPGVTTGCGLHLPLDSLEVTIWTRDVSCPICQARLGISPVSTINEFTGLDTP
jgi:hypothetical protein